MCKTKVVGGRLLPLHRRGYTMHTAKFQSNDPLLLSAQQICCLRDRIQGYYHSFRQRLVSSLHFCGGRPLHRLRNMWVLCRLLGCGAPVDFLNLSFFLSLNFLLQVL
ncbi:unnamed protein product [Ectocarpus sp. 12 AP-2014]